jgi:hypothetical protein
MEGNMNKLRLSTAASLTLACVFSATLAYAAGAPDQSTTDQVIKSQSDDQALVNKGKDARANPQSGATANDSAAKTPPAKHPPTAIMDRATSTDKPAAATSKAAGHGPTSVMDRAAPDQKSPGGEASKDSETPAR